ncbi:NTP transferase domain-containing protein [Albimonas pacifica]|uniref:Molybdopterin molybdochelatase /molybdenum cofactor cytidylyltransferase n=1 Tax=Albimonas pacifica TaxID=1114924 RepID=A0A1I3N064_9RHOB|nr:molybdopterin molybdochelatase /molybdenum cofactor cytidylyltransferase [Albimonas pacifica]
MRFGPLPLAEAEGAVLAHSLTAAGRRLKKGCALTAGDLAALREAGFATVTAARLGPEDLSEDQAAATLAAALAPDPLALGVSRGAPFTGRANLHALSTGVLRVDRARIDAANAVDEAITVSTLADWSRVSPRTMVATVKIIPYAAPREAVARAAAILSGGGLSGGGPALRSHPVRLRRASLALTHVPGMKPRLLDKGAEALAARLAALGMSVADEARTPHEIEALAAALRAARGEMILVLGGSAPSDRRDVAPAAVEAAGGRLIRFGMPVDPGNLMFLGDLDGRPVLGMPGSSRSPALSGTDWVLERLACGLEVTAADIAGMGVGGLLKEIPSRPQPRAGGAGAAEKPFVTALLLAAGASSRMQGRDKLLEEVGGEPVLRRSARALVASGADEVIAVLRPGDEARRAALSGLAVTLVENPEAAEGMAASIRRGLSAADPEADAVLLALADMPEVASAHADALIEAFDPARGAAICRAADAEGRPGHPVLFGRRFFESLSRLTGDEGARDILRTNADFVRLVKTEGRGARLDLDTPEAWAAWRAEQTG